MYAHRVNYKINGKKYSTVVMGESEKEVRRLMKNMFIDGNYNDAKVISITRIGGNVFE